MRKLKIAAALAVVGVVAAAATVGAMSSTRSGAQAGSQYLVPMYDGIKLQQLMKAGDSFPKTGGGGTYRMVGVPDGLGAFDNGDGTFTVLMNHELTNLLGVPRSHGAKGAFVSKWSINKKDLKVVSGEDLIKTVYTWTNGAYAVAPSVAFSRFCSADLPPISAFYNKDTGKGYNGRLFMNGEESGAEGRGWAHELNGSSWELPYLGKFSWENSLANPATGDKTVVMGDDDQGGGKGQIYMYVGAKQSSGDAPTRAGLVGGKLYGVKVDGAPVEPAGGILGTSTRFSMFEFGDVSKMTGAALELASNAAGVTNFKRPEDGAWDPKNPNVFYFVTTDQFPGTSRLWQLTFDDVKNAPEKGGKIEMLLAGNEGQQMLDNITVDQAGRIIALEDIGEQVYRGKIWKYVLATDTVVDVAVHNDDLFIPGKPGFITADEESSGVIDMADILGPGWYLLDDQLHLPWSPPGYPAAPSAATTFPYNDAEIVEGGALYAAYFPIWKPGKKTS